MKIIAIFIALIAITNPAFAQGNKRPDCKAPQTQMAMNYCAHSAYQAADRTLNQVYQKTMAAQPGQHRNALYQAQIAWLRYRDLACNSYSLMAAGGTMQPMLYSNCLAGLTTARTGLLQEQLDGQGN